MVGPLFNRKHLILDGAVLVALLIVLTPVKRASFEMQRLSSDFSNSLLTSAERTEILGSLRNDIGEELEHNSTN